MTEPISLDERRWHKEERPDRHSIAGMLRVALGRLERGEIDPKHAIVVFGVENDDGSVSSAWMQAGDFNPFAQIGLLQRAAARFMRPAD